MKRILVPTDFSTCANNAVDFAVQSAKILPLEITLVNAFELSGDTYADYMGVNKEFNQSQLHEVNNKLAALKNSIEEKEKVVVDTCVFAGAVKMGILQVTSERDIDLIVMGTAGANGLKEKLWGSKTADIIGKSQVPVMAIPLQYTWKKPQRILLATNHFEKDATLLDFIFELADLFQAQVQVAVFTNEVDDGAITFMEHARKIPEYEAMLREQYKKEMIIIAHLFGDHFEETLQEYIRQNEIDILTLITHKRSFPDKIFHPGITKKMSYHTKIPLLAIPVKNVD